MRELEEAALSILGVVGVRWYPGARDVGVELHVTDNGSHDSPAAHAATEKMRAAMPEVSLRLVGVLCPL